MTDIEMPRMGGLELAQAVKDLPTRVVILTTFGRAATSAVRSRQGRSATC